MQGYVCVCVCVQASMCVGLCVCVCRDVCSVLCLGWFGQFYGLFCFCILDICWTGLVQFVGLFSC